MKRIKIKGLQSKDKKVVIIPMVNLFNNHPAFIAFYTLDKLVKEER